MFIYKSEAGLVAELTTTFTSKKEKREEKEKKKNEHVQAAEILPGCLKQHQGLMHCTFAPVTQKSWTGQLVSVS